MSAYVTKELSYDERRIWGECPVCHAKHGEGCKPGVGEPLGLSVSGHPPENGVHLGRLHRAPMKVQIIPIG